MQTRLAVVSKEPNAVPVQNHEIPERLFNLEHTLPKGSFRHTDLTLSNHESSNVPDA